jgi:hypothetical protein
LVIRMCNISRKIALPLLAVKPIKQGPGVRALSNYIIG